MQSHRDHYQAYRFGAGRLDSALVTGDPGAGENPQRRARFGAILGLVGTALAAAACAIYGLLVPSTTDWAKAGPFLADKANGSRYLNIGGELHPVLNYASALLAVQGRVTAPTKVPRSDLDRLRPGRPVGIAGAPDSLPAPGVLIAGAWTYCLSGPPVRLGRAGVPMTGRVLVAGSGKSRYVLWGNAKYPVRQRTAMAVLGVDRLQPATAPAAWLAGLPTGPEIAAATVSGAGTAGPRIGHQATRVGDALAGPSGGYYAVRADGLAPVSATEAFLLAAARNRPIRPVTAGDIGAVPASADRTLLTRLPDLARVPDTTGTPGALCLDQRQDGAAVRSTVVRVAGPAAGKRAVVPAGAGMLAATPAGSREYLITDQGEKYALGDGAQTSLGYGSIRPATYPTYLLDLIPSGPALSVAAASTEESR